MFGSFKVKVVPCIPTDSVVLKLAGDITMLNITYHVTYWDRLEWKDIFRDSVFEIKANRNTEGGAKSPGQR